MKRSNLDLDRLGGFCVAPSPPLAPVSVPSLSPFSLQAKVSLPFNGGEKNQERFNARMASPPPPSFLPPSSVNARKRRRRQQREEEEEARQTAN